jgi:hypothetical protein
LILRNLPKREYALYTLCNSMLSTILLLADSGLSSALMAIGGRVWHDRGKLSQLIQTAMQLRRLFSAIAIVVVVPVLLWLLRRNGATHGKAAALLVIVLVGCGLELVTRIYAVALRLKSEVRQIQNQALVAAIVKAAIVGVAVAVWFNIEIAVLAVVAGYAVQYGMLNRWQAKHLDAGAEPDPQMRREIISVVRQQSSHLIYYCLQAQLTVWLISIFGNADRVADVGALSRLAVVFSILGSLTNELVFPAFARIQVPAMLRRRYLQIVFGFSVLCGLMIAVVAIFPDQVLSVLGGQYKHLHAEGILMAVSTVLGAIAGLTWGLNAARAWIVPPMTYILVTIALQALLVKFVDFSTVRGVLYFSILSGIFSLVWSMSFALMRIHQQKTA